MNAIYDLIGEKAYNAKMMHTIPTTPVVERERYLLEQVKGKVVVDIGASGPMHEAIKRAAAKCYGIDLHAPTAEYYFKVNLDQARELPFIPGLELVIAGEVIEHLDNAGHFLDLLKQYSVPIILTTPNAFNAVGFREVEKKGMEVVNPEHVCYYSYWTLLTLIQKHGFELLQWFWYKGRPRTAEGLIFVMEARRGTS